MSYSVRTQLVVAVKGVETMPFWIFFLFINFRIKRKLEKSIKKKKFHLRGCSPSPEIKTKNAMEIKTDFKHLSGCLG